MSKKLVALIALVVFAASFPLTILARSDSRISNTITVSENEIVEDDFFAAGDIVEINGIIEGDAYVFAQEVYVNGRILGDLIGAAANASISGDIEGNLRFAALDLDYSGSTLKNATIAGGTTRIRGKIDNNAYVAAGTFILSESSAIGGNLSYTSDPDEFISPDASIAGTITRTTASETHLPSEQNLREVGYIFDGFAKVISFITTFFFGFLILKCLPNYSARANELLLTTFGKSFLAGIITLIALPFVIGFLFVTIIGIPFALFVLALFIFYAFIARIFVILAAGNFLVRKTEASIQNKYIILTLGIFAYYLLSLIPIIGGIIKIIVLVAGLGAAMRNARNSYTIARNKKLL